ncbi:MAG TPA: hypothetical protein DCZ94_20370 [Lentisphaeria bacterium]|nr:MAG: hypothetical protein A2X48_22170 [Lentisphaerae bacterium GWF2_49_21]HBC89303.1 hypothetical protein [Lentisphaeria bacterium]
MELERIHLLPYVEKTGLKKRFHSVFRSGGLCRVKYCANPVRVRNMCILHYKRYAEKKILPLDTHLSPNSTEIEGAVSSIRLRNSSNRTVAEALIDTDDALKVGRHIWSLGGRGVKARIKGKSVMLSRFISDCDGKLLVAYLNRDSLDFRKKNLRVVDHSEIRIWHSKTPSSNASG